MQHSSCIEWAVLTDALRNHASGKLVQHLQFRYNCCSFTYWIRKLVFQMWQMLWWVLDWYVTVRTCRVYWCWTKTITTWASSWTGQHVSFLFCSVEVLSRSCLLLIQSVWPSHLMEPTGMCLQRTSTKGLCGSRCCQYPSDVIYWRWFADHCDGCLCLLFHVCSMSNHHIVLDLITLIIFIKQYKLWSFSSCSPFHPHCFFPLSSKHLSLHSYLKCCWSVFPH